MPSNLHEVCFWPMLRHNHDVVLPALAIPSEPLSKVGPCRRTVGRSCAGASIARLASPNAAPRLCRTSGIRPLSPTRAVPSWPSGSLPSPPAMRTAMMPIASGTTRWVSAAWSGHPSSPPRPWHVPPPCARLDHSVARTDLSRLTHALVDHCLASFPEPPAALVRALDHADDPPPGQQAFAFYHHHSRSSGSGPLGMVEGPSHAVGTACRRPGTRPPGRANALSLVRRRAGLRRHGPQPPLLVRGDSHWATPEVGEVLAQRRGIAFVCGGAGQAVVLRQAAPSMPAARGLSQQRTAQAQAQGARPPRSSRVSAECAAAAASWAQPWRVLVQAEGMAAGAKPRGWMQTSTAPGDMAKTTSRPCSMPSTVTAPRRPPSWPTLCDSGGRAPPRSSTMPSAPPRSRTRHSPPRTPLR